MNTDISSLTSGEMGKLWATYAGNTMADCVLSYYLKNVEDKDIKKVLQYALDLTRTYIKDIEMIFKKGGFPIPVGLTEDDVNLEAPRLFKDEFYLYYLQYTAKAGISLYSAAISIVTRKDIRDFYMKALHDVVKLMNHTNDILKSRGLLMNTPKIPNPKGVDFVHDPSFLNGYLGDVRPLHGLEIAHLYDNINNDVTSKALIIGFSQGAKNNKVRKFLERGRNLNEKHIEKLSKKLREDYLPFPSLLDHLVTSSTIPPFSDKLMVFHKVDMFSMKVREYANGASLNGRKDIGALYARCLMDVSFYVKSGANILIEHGWMEQPPFAVNRDQLSSND
ncbi:Protein of unknown function [Halobacillus karajensis]|uniref:DUF3231 family protein n=1 Tax=Halobacillus karajensis TaxID=195088 RepID=A0A024P7T1_9BACI|nr:DUF3231 family protein [Halobacillus karajensis]CDQ20165.1 hypothetical protein BN982_02482 [Halobacillus karajensis]CDQ25174.1 hypothetical protein BN983_03485 [Halobacillus karajensis]CDQ28465.1 hypothetical protein BN981_02767 [Halobacillus karajensis]SEI01461.1 Protein of unknown function [Halobacillus karajensis]